MLKKALAVLLSRWFVPRETLEIAYSLIIRHHDICVMEKLEWGGDCPVCACTPRGNADFCRVIRELDKPAISRTKSLLLRHGG